MITTMTWKLTELFRAAVFQNLFVGRIESDAPHHVSDLGAVNEAISTVPEVEQIKHFLHVCTQRQLQYKPSRRSAATLPVPARPSVLVSHAPGVTSRFWLSRRRPSPLFRPAAGLRSPPAARACRARPSAVRQSVHVSHARGVTSSQSGYYI